MNRGAGYRIMALVSGMAYGAMGCAATQTKLERGVETMHVEAQPDQLAARGDAFASAGDMTRAEQYFAGALRNGGDAPRLVRRLVAVCAADGRYPVALEYADDYLRNHPHDIDVRYAAATLHLAIGDEKGAREELAAVIGAKPGFADAHYTLALLEKNDGDPIAADKEFRAYLAVDPTGTHREVAQENLLKAVP